MAVPDKKLNIIANNSKLSRWHRLDKLQPVLFIAKTLLIVT